MGPMPENVSSFGGEIDQLITTITWITGVVFVIAEAVLLFSILRFRKKNNPKASYLAGVGWAQTRWIFLPVLAVVALDFYIDERTNHVWDLIKGSVPKADMTIRITGQQFAWVFTQPGPDGELGTADDFQQTNDLHVPIDANIVFQLEARDVLHSFWVPSLRLKQDAIPGRTIQGWFKATKVGTYDIACAEICGVGHTSMKATLHVHPKDEYLRDWSKPKAVSADPKVRGEALLTAKACVACHSTDGQVKVGPSYKGLWGKKETVVTGGAEREVTVDEEYLRRSILDPGADVVKGFPASMPSQRGLVTDAEINDIIEYLKELKLAHRGVFRP